MRSIVELKAWLSAVRRAVKRCIIGMRMRHCMYDLAHIEQTRRNDFIAERLRHRQLVALRAMLHELERTAEESRQVR